MVKKNKSGWIAWSEHEVELLKRLFQQNSVREISEQIGRPFNSVQQRAYKLGLRKQGLAPVWSKKELSLLRRLYPTRTAGQIAEQIGRTMPATMARIFRLGLRKRKLKA